MVLGTNAAVTIVDKSGLVIFDRADLPAKLPAEGQSMAVTARGEFGSQRDNVTRPAPQSEQAQHRAEPVRDEPSRKQGGDDYER